MEPLYIELRLERAAGLRRLSSEAIAEMVQAIRSAKRLPRLGYHFAQHGAEMGAAREEDYEQAFREHLSQPRLRVFTYLRPRGRAPFWELVDPATGRTALYNERERDAWSFFTPTNAQARDHNTEGWWVEVVFREGSWEREEQWRWDV